MATQNRSAVFVSAPAGRAKSLLSSLKLKGFDCLHFPAFRIEWLSLQQPQTHPDCVIVTSPNAALGAARNNIVLPPNAAYFAVGQGSAAAIQTLGINNVNYPNQAGSEFLLELPEFRNGQHQHAWLLTGEGGRGLLETELTKLNIQFIRMASYRRVANLQSDALSAVLKQTAPQLSIASSAEALDNLARISDADSMALLGQCHWLVSSQRIALRLQQHWPNAEYTLCAGPDDNSLVTACLAWKQGL